jgi:hypothetical protein
VNAFGSVVVLEFEAKLPRVGADDIVIARVIARASPEHALTDGELLQRRAVPQQCMFGQVAQQRREPVCSLKRGARQHALEGIPECGGVRGGPRFTKLTPRTHMRLSRRHKQSLQRKSARPP